MSARHPVFAVLVDGGRSVRMRRDTWTYTFPVEKLDGWIAFYESLCKRAQGQHEKHHRPNVDALKKVKAKIEAARNAG